MPAMVMNAPPNGSNGVDTSGVRHASNFQKSLPIRRRLRKGYNSNGHSNDNEHQSNTNTTSTSHQPHHIPHHPSSDITDGVNAMTNTVPLTPLPQHETIPSPPPIKPNHSGKMAHICIQNASYMGARTYLNICPPGSVRDAYLTTLQNRRRKRKNLSAPVPIRRSLSFTRASSINTVASRAEEVSGIEKILGESGVAEYTHLEESFLTNPEIRRNDVNSDGEEIQEDASSGDNDELDINDMEDEIEKEERWKECPEPLYCGTDGGGDIRGSANSGKIAFNFRKLKWFDAVTASDRATARQYIKKEIANMKKRDLKALTNHLKKYQKREKRRIEIEKGRRARTASVSDKLQSEEDEEENLHQFSGIGKLPSPMTPALSAALVIESLYINPFESVEGMAKCYEGIVAAGSALLDSKMEEPSDESNSSGNSNSSSNKKKHSKDDIMNALTPLLITSLEQPSGDAILALAKLRKACGTKRYQRRFVQRIAPFLIRPPNAAMWCLRHQQDMESIFAACELILDKSHEVFHKEWYERGRTILADSKRAETLNAAATQLKSLSNGQPSDRLMKGLTGQKGGVHRRSRSGSIFERSNKDHGTGTAVMAEWEILAVDQQIRDSIHNLFTMDWQRVVLSNAPPRDGEPQSKKLRGISDQKSRSKLSSNDGDTNSVSSNNEQSYVTSPPRLHPNRMLPSNNSVSFNPANSNGPRTSQSPESSSPVLPNKDIKSENVPSSDSNIHTNSNINPVYDPSPPPLSPRTNEHDITHTPPRSPPHSLSYLSPRNHSHPLSPQKYTDSPNLPSNVESTKSPAPLSPVNSYRRQHESAHQRFSSSNSGTSPSAQSKYLRTLTSTAAERKRTVAACRALRAQIARFEEAFIKMHGRPPKGAAERAPLATTYAQYREWKRAIRADAASRIQALARGARVRSYLVRDPKFRDIVRQKAGRPKKISHLSIPEPNEVVKQSKMLQQPIAPMPRRDDGSVEIVMAPTYSWPSKRSVSEVSHDSSTLNASQYTRNSNISNTFKLEISLFSLPELQTRKRELKQELKKYDVTFFNQNGRMPVKAEKEPIRHLYEKYNQLKNRITAVERDPSLIQQLAPSQQPTQQQQPTQHNTGSRRKSSMNMPSSPDNIISNNVSPRNEPPNSHNLQNHTRNDSYSRHSNTVSSTSSPTTSSSLSQDLGALKTEKQTLHQMLRSYEKDFFKKYNRQVSSYADIRPVASQYRRYKEIKKSIVALQSAAE